MSKFSGALQLTDLNDFITPSQACVRPVKIDQSDQSNITSIEVNNDTGQYYQVNIDGTRKELSKTKIDLSDCLACSGCVTSAESVLVNQQSVTQFLKVLKRCFGFEPKIEKIEKMVDSNDSNEKTSENDDKQTIMEENNEDDGSDDDDDVTSSFEHFIVSIAPQSLASIAAHFNCSIRETERRLHYMFHCWMRAERVFDTTWSRHLSHWEMCHEFVQKFSLIAQQRLMNQHYPQTSNTSATTTTASANQNNGGSVGVSSSSSSVIPSAGSRRARRAAAAVSSTTTTGTGTGTDNDSSVIGTSMGIPMLASSCPGFVCYAEKSFGEFIIPFIATTKSPQQIMGSIVKQYMCEQNVLSLTSNSNGNDNGGDESTQTKQTISPSQIYHVSIMPCFDKKLEASRDDFMIGTNADTSAETSKIKEVDIVLTSSELVQILTSQFGIENREQFMNMGQGAMDQSSHESYAGLDTPLVTLSDDERALLSHGILDSMESGGYTEVLFRFAAKKFFGVHLPAHVPLSYKMGRNSDFKEVSLEIEDAQKQKRTVMKFAVANGFRNIQNVIRKLKSSRCDYDFIEVMACPSGCVNGGGQNTAPESVAPRDFLQTVKTLYRDTLVDGERLTQTTLKQFYEKWIGGDAFSDRAKSKLHTQYHARQQVQINPLTIQW